MGCSTAGNDGDALVSASVQPDPTLDDTARQQRVITLLDHVTNDGLLGSDTLPSTPADRFGNDYLAGGADDDLIFGQLGDDVIQGDGGIGEAQSDGTSSGWSAARATGEAEALTLAPSFENDDTDGDDYIEGNGGDDVIFGNLGQDDIVGGSSDLFGLTARSQRPDGRDLIFGGAGTDIDRNDAGDGLACPRRRHDRRRQRQHLPPGRNQRRAGGGYLSFNYDSTEFNGVLGASGYDDDLKIIPRAVELLDYTPGGPDFDAVNAALDIGAGDEVHGESGDDTVYGQVGNDVLFGEARTTT